MTMRVPKEGSIKRTIYDMIVAGHPDADIQRACPFVKVNTFATYLCRMKQLARANGELVRPTEETK